MELDELQSRLEHMRRLKSLEESSKTSNPSYFDMDREELIRFVEFLLKTQDDLKKSLEAADERIAGLLKQNEQMTKAQNELLSQNASLQKSLNALTEEIRLSRKVTYGAKSRKQRSSKASGHDGRGRDETRDDFDGGGASASEVNIPVEESDSPAPSGSECRAYRKGMKYRTMKAARAILHKSDSRQLPAGSVIIRHYTKFYSLEERLEFVQHDVEILVYKTPDGKIRSGYFPMGEDDVRQSEASPVPGTHAAANFFSHEIMHAFQLFTPLYRGLRRFRNESLNISDGTLSNWFSRGAEFLRCMIPYLKDIALEKDAIVNCDETWCRVRKFDTYSKKYIWCLVNKCSKVVIFVYDDGSRARRVLRSIIEDREIKALQSDGYNVYTFIDKEFEDVTHLCCMAHARSKFVDAQEIGKDERAGFFVKQIGRLYDLEKQYRFLDLSAEEIRRRRQSPETIEIVTQIRMELSRLLSSGDSPMGELMQKALRYMNTFWTQLFAYREDGRYSIDNNIAERHIRPLTVGRKNSLFFGSGKSAEVATVYHTFIGTCQMLGISALKYFRMFFSAIAEGRRDYENLLPQTIGIINNR